jgi:hypothetical protein
LYLALRALHLVARAHKSKRIKIGKKPAYSSKVDDRFQPAQSPSLKKKRAGGKPALTKGEIR